jgi:hypothetical protein
MQGIVPPLFIFDLRSSVSSAANGFRFSPRLCVSVVGFGFVPRHFLRSALIAGQFIFDLRSSVSSAAIVLDFSAPLCLRGKFCFRTRALPAIRVNSRPTYLLSAFFCVHLRQIVFGFRRAGRSAL